MVQRGIKQKETRIFVSSIILAKVMKQHLALLKYIHITTITIVQVLFHEIRVNSYGDCVKELVLGHLPDNGLEEVGLVGSSSWLRTGREFARIRCRNSASLA